MKSIPSESARRAAAAYVSIGQIPIPVPRGAKSPTLKGWQKLRVTEADLAKHFPDDRSVNVGLVLADSAKVADVDLDAPEAVAAGNRWLPWTGWVSGRSGKPKSHRWYRPDAAVRYKAFDAPDGTRLMELRSGEGFQTIAPPSLHPSGDEVVWESFDDEPAPIPGAVLVRIVGETAALSLLVRQWPKVAGRRQDAFLALAGGLARANWDTGRGEEFLAAIADLTGDEERRARTQTFARTAEKVKAGEATTGWKSLAGLLGDKGMEAVRSVREWLGCGGNGDDKDDAPTDDEPPPWPDLIPLLTPLPDLPPFPSDVLPPWLRNWADATAEALQVPVDLPATLAIAVCSAGVARKFVANPRPGWFEPTNSYWVCALPPSDRKSQTFARAVGPVFDLQDRTRAEAAPGRREAEATQKAMAKRIGRLEDAYAKATDPVERQQAMDELQQAREELDQLVVPPEPILVVDDETPDNLAKVICEQQGRLLQASAEGTLFENIERWSDKPSFDVYLKAFSGDPLSVGRVTRDRTECRHPALTCAIAPQPSVIEGLGEHPALAGRGFLARWMYSLPKSKVGRRKIAPEPVPDAVADAYRNGVITLWSLPGTTDEDGNPQTHRIEFTREADEAVRRYERELEPRLAEGEDLWFMHGWAGKAVGGAVRIATVLHLAEGVANDNQSPEPVPLAVVERTIRLSRDYLIPHARAAFGLMGTDPRVNLAKRVVRWFTGLRLDSFTVRDAHQAMRGAFQTVDDLRPVLALIERHHYIRPAADVGPKKPGRPRAQRYEVNPEALSGDPEGGGSEGGGPPRPHPTGPGGQGGFEDIESFEGESGSAAPNCTPSGQGSAWRMTARDGRDHATGRGEGSFEGIECFKAPSRSPNAGRSSGRDWECGVAGATQITQYPQNPTREAGRASFEDIECFEARATTADPKERYWVGLTATERGSTPQNTQITQNSPAHTGIDDGAGMSDPRPTHVAGPPAQEMGGWGAAQITQNTQNSTSLRPSGGDRSPLDGAQPRVPPAGYDGGVEAPPHILIATPGDLSMVLGAVAESTWVGVDCETTGLDPRSDRVRLIALDCDTNDGGRLTYLVDAFAVDVAALWEPLAAARIILHNAAFDLGFLCRLGFVPGCVDDTLLLSNVLHAGARTKGVAPVKHGLKDCCQRELGIELKKDLQASDWSGSLTKEQLEYAARDAAVLVPLHKALTAKLDAAKLADAAAIESAAIPCVAWMSAAGVPFDAGRWRSLAETAKLEAQRAREALDAAAPPKPDGLFDGTWNWDSPDQARQALVLAGCDVESTADGILAALDHPLANLLRDHREAGKRASTYGESWLKHVAADGRVYPRWVQLGANSGRMACSAPNMQNLPRGEYRKCVAAGPGRVLVKADYSQVELRIAAKVSGDRALLSAYQRGEDLHTLTARQVLGIADVTKEHRQLAKALNFGLLYGMGAKGFRAYARANYGLELTESQADGYREAFFQAYPGLRRWHRAAGNQPKDTRTLAGRRALRVDRFNEKLNLPVQGTGADGLKKALALLWERRAECASATPVLAVHDEIVVECPEGDAGIASDWLRRAMLDGMAPLVDPVPVEVEVKVGRTWGGD